MLHIGRIDRIVIRFSVGHVRGKEDKSLRGARRDGFQQAASSPHVHVSKPFVSISMRYTTVKLTRCKMINHIIPLEMKLTQVTKLPHVTLYEIY